MKVLNDTQGRIDGSVQIEQDELCLLEEACESLLADIVETEHPDVQKLRDMMNQFQSMFYSWGK